MPEGVVLVGPARDVPWPVRLQFLFGGFANQFGWAFFGFGLIFARVFAFQTDVAALRDFRGPLTHAPAAVTQVERTSYTVNKRAVLAYRYRFDAGGRAYTGVSYGFQRDLPARVEFPSGRPEAARLEGLGRKPMPSETLVVLVFPIAGLGILLSGLRKGLRGIRLLRRGMLATGRLASKTATNTKINDQTVYSLRFKFQTVDGRWAETRARTHLVDRLTDDAEEPLVYDAGDPSNALMLDDLPGRPRIDAESVTRTYEGSVAPLLAIPGLSAVVHLAWWLLAR